MQVRAKFRVQTRTEHAPGVFSRDAEPVPYYNVNLSPITGDEGEDLAFTQGTPAGNIELTVHQDAAGFFDPGSVVYVDFSKA